MIYYYFHPKLIFVLTFLIYYFYMQISFPNTQEEGGKQHASLKYVKSREVAGPEMRRVSASHGVMDLVRVSPAEPLLSLYSKSRGSKQKNTLYNILLFICIYFFLNMQEEREKITCITRYEKYREVACG
jgi:preprotein translocase subunit YajC